MYTTLVADVSGSGVIGACRCYLKPALKDIKIAKSSKEIPSH